MEVGEEDSRPAGIGCGLGPVDDPEHRIGGDEGDDDDEGGGGDDPAGPAPVEREKRGAPGRTRSLRSTPVITNPEITKKTSTPT